MGRWFASRPAEVTDRVVLATKGRFSTEPDINAIGSSRRALGRALDASLRRLQRDSVDLYQLHAWDPITLVEETRLSSTAPSAPARSVTWACRTSPAGSSSS